MVARKSRKRPLIMWDFLDVVPPVRLELTHLSVLDFESSASTIPPRGQALGLERTF